MHKYLFSSSGLFTRIIIVVFNGAKEKCNISTINCKIIAFQNVYFGLKNTVCSLLFALPRGLVRTCWCSPFNSYVKVKTTKNAVNQKTNCAGDIKAYTWDSTGGFIVLGINTGRLFWGGILYLRTYWINFNECRA